MKKRLFAVSVTLLLAISLFAGGSSEGGTTRLIIGTSSSGSTYQIMGTGWADIMKDELPNVEISVEVTPGGITNIQSMANGDMDFGMTTSWIGGDGYAGTGWAEGKAYTNIKSMFPTHSSVMYIFTLANSGIDDIYDIEGKNVGCGPLGGTSGDATGLILDALGITPRNITHLSSQGVCDALKDGTIDVGFGVTGIPASWLMDLQTSQDVKIISLTEEEIADILEAQPFWAAGIIPANSYDDQPEDVDCIEFWNMVVANDSLSEDLIYNLTKATYETVDQLCLVDGNAAGINVENLDTMTVPLHPGALRYYEEIGADIPEKLR